MTKSKSAAQHKERGTLLTIWLILMAVWGLLSAYLVYYFWQQHGNIAIGWVLPTLFVVALAKVVAAIALWKWKRWGFWVYGIAIAVGIAAGLVFTRSQLIVFHDIIPLVITGYLVRDKRALFD